MALKKVALGMSGGVDSSVCAHLLKEQGYDVTGVFLECWRAPGCRSEEDRKDALKVALDLDIPFKVLDFKDAYKNRVVEHFFAEYEAGRTPNPDVMCNKEIKFGLFYDWAMAEGFDYVATGHYAQLITSDVTGTPELYLQSSLDDHKDQTYFLYRLSAHQLEHILFPVGGLTKPAVRSEAHKRNIVVADKKDSVGICFIGDINVHDFLRERLGENPGEVIDTQGNVIGKHQGLWFYTVGQRHGFEIDAKTLVKQEDGHVISRHNIPPFYVIKKLPRSNQLMVGFGAETYRQNWEIHEVHIINAPEVSMHQLVEWGNMGTLLARIRHTGQLWPCTVKSISDHEHSLVISVSTPIQGVAEGQSTVLYLDQGSRPPLCLAGGVIACP